jgi:hypothetical protein
MGTIQVCGGGTQVVQFRTASGHTSSRLGDKQCENLEMNDSGDQLWVDFCFSSSSPCGEPSDGPADILPGDSAVACVKQWQGTGMTITRDGQTIYHSC